MELDEKSIYAKVASTFSDVSEEVKIPVEPKSSLDRLLVKFGLKKKRHLTYRLRKIRVANRVKIAGRALKLPKGIFSGKIVLYDLYKTSVDFSDDLVYIAAVCLQNDRNEPTQELLDALGNLEDGELADILDKGLSMIDFPSFLKSIVLIAGTEDLTPEND